MLDVFEGLAGTHFTVRAIPYLKKQKIILSALSKVLL